MSNSVLFIGIVFVTMIFGQCIHMMATIFIHELNNYFKASNARLVN